MRELPMPEGEICTNYRQAANKRKQIGILAELNAAEEREIVQILVEHGEEVDRRLIRKLTPLEPEPVLLNANCNWTTDEEERLEQLTAEGKDDQEIGDLLGRTAYAVKKKRQQILRDSLSRPRPERVRRNVLTEHDVLVAIARAASEGENTLAQVLSKACVRLIIQITGGDEDDENGK